MSDTTRDRLRASPPTRLAHRLGGGAASAIISRFFDDLAEEALREAEQIAPLRGAIQFAQRSWSAVLDQIESEWQAISSSGTWSGRGER